VALTFDDDLASHVDSVAPVLLRHGVPATLFLSGRSLEDAAPFWWQDLDVAATGRADLGALVRRLGLPSDTECTIKGVAEAVTALEPARRRVAEDTLRSLAGAHEVDRGIRAEDVGALATHGFEIGFHTLNHDALAMLTTDEVHAGLRNGRAVLEEAAGTRINAFAYPHGSASREVAAAVRAAGYLVAFTTQPRVISDAEDPMLLPRWTARSGDSIGLAAELAHALLVRPD